MYIKIDLTGDEVKNGWIKRSVLLFSIFVSFKALCSDALYASDSRLMLKAQLEHIPPCWS